MFRNFVELEVLVQDSPLLLKPERVMERLDMGRTKVYELMSTGELESIKVGRARRVPADAVDAYIERLRAEQAA